MKVLFALWITTHSWAGLDAGYTTTVVPVPGVYESRAECIKMAKSMLPFSEHVLEGLVTFRCDRMGQR